MKNIKIKMNIGTKTRIQMIINMFDRKLEKKFPIELKILVGKLNREVVLSVSVWTFFSSSSVMLDSLVIVMLNWFTN